MKKRPSPPSKWSIVQAWKDWLALRLIDLDYPCCFACKKPAYDGPTLENYGKMWEKSNLQRAHLIPHSLDGPNDPSNYFLLCAECHKLAPTTVYKDDMIKWAEKQPFYIYKDIQEFMDALTRFLEPEEVKQFLAWAMQYKGKPEILGKMIYERVNEFSVHGTNVPRSTYAAMMVRIWRENTAS